jgi:hypothetical protein
MRQLTAALLVTGALVGSFAVASAATPRPVAFITGAQAKSPPSSNPLAPRKPFTTLYDQNNNDEGVAVVSQNFTSGSGDSFDSQGADDFVVPTGHRWTIKEVDVTGQYPDGPGPASSENVFLYTDNGGLPGKPIGECDNVVGKDNGSGSFVIVLPRTCYKKLKAGTYWISVQINMNFGCCGEWLWEKQATVEGNPAAWQNPGDGFGTGCTTWAVENKCWGLAAPTTPNGDKMFTIKGKDISTR